MDFGCNVVTLCWNKRTIDIYYHDTFSTSTIVGGKFGQANYKMPHQNLVANSKLMSLN